MSQPIMLSDEEEDPHPISTSFNQVRPKKRRTEPDPNPNTFPTVVVLDDDPTPQKRGPATSSTPTFVPETPLSDAAIIKCSRALSDRQTAVSSSELKSSESAFVPETPMFDLTIGKCSSASFDRQTTVSNSEHAFTEYAIIPDTPMSDVAIVKCSRALSNAQTTVSNSEHKFSDLGINGLIFLESDNESEDGFKRGNWKRNETMESVSDDAVKDIDSSSRFMESAYTFSHADATQISEDGSLGLTSLQDDIPQESDSPQKESVSIDQTENIVQKKRTRGNTEKKKNTGVVTRRKKVTEEERIQLKEEKKLKKLQEKLQKAALKAEAAELKKIEKERKKWENGKFALKSIVAEIDAKVVEMGSVGGNLLMRFAEKGVNYRITSNPIERSILWTMKFPENISELSSEGVEIRYVLLVYEAEEFCNLVTNESLLDHVFGVRSRYPSYAVCYLTNRLMSYINKREKEHYKNPINHNGWRCPPVEEVLAKLTTHFVKVHSRQCVDEAELAEHVVGLTCSLASCQFRKKLTRLSVNANGSLIPKDSVDRNLIQKNLWLKALVAIPKVQPRFAIAIWKKYPTVKSLLSVYMDQSKSVHEKEFLLKDLRIEGLLGEDRRLGEVCSKRVYRILMAQSGSIKTDDVEEGADFFGRQSS